MKLIRKSVAECGDEVLYKEVQLALVMSGHTLGGYILMVGEVDLEKKSQKSWSNKTKHFKMFLLRMVFRHPVIQETVLC